MEIFKIGGKYYCMTKCGFTLQQIAACLDKQLGMRKGSFAAQYSKRIFRDLLLYAKDLLQEYYD